VCIQLSTGLAAVALCRQPQPSHPKEKVDMGAGISRIDSAAQHSVREPYNNKIGPLALDQTEVSGLVKVFE